MEATDNDPEVLRDIEEDQNIQIIPGTEIMIDAGNHHFIRSAADRVLVPQPSSDPHDPLNWDPFWKASTTASATFVSFAQGFGPLAIAPMFPMLAQEFKSDLSSVVQFTGVTILVLGFSNFIWIPLSSTFGRRPVLLASTLVSLGSSIWKAKATTYGSFMGACVLNGLGAGPGETLQPQIITDYVFLHDRGKYNTLYFALYFGSLALSPVVAGLLAEHTGWRNFWWLNVALLGAAFVVSFFAFPETRWHRHRANDIQTKTRHPSSTSLATNPEMNGKTSPPNLENGVADQPYTPVQTPIQHGKPGRKQFDLFQPNQQPLKTLLIELWTPFKLFAFPIVDFASLVVAWSTASFLIVNLTQSQAFSESPYQYTAQTVGFFNFAVVVGLLLGLGTAGPLNDWISMRATKRNKGIREPEMRLPAMIPYTLIMILGNFVVGFGYQYHWDWKAIVIVGYTCAGIQVASIPAIASTYAIDSYKPVTGSIFVNVTVVKNLWGYGLSRFITEWSIADGFVDPFMTNMCLTALWCICGVLFWYKGKALRHRTKDSNIHDT